MLVARLIACSNFFINFGRKESQDEKVPDLDVVRTFISQPDSTRHQCISQLCALKMSFYVVSCSLPLSIVSNAIANNHGCIIDQEDGYKENNI